MGEQRGAGVKMGVRCFWDAEADSYAYDKFINVRNKFFIQISIIKMLINSIAC